jgi:hypothetical protein
LKVFDRKSHDRGDGYSVITSTGVTVRFSNGRVMLREAMAAMIPGMKPQSMGARFQYLAKVNPRLDINGHILNGARGSRFAVDKNTFEEIVRILLEYEDETIEERGRNPEELVPGVAYQVLQGFDPWNHKSWFPPL